MSKKKTTKKASKPDRELVKVQKADKLGELQTIEISKQVLAHYKSLGYTEVK